MMCFAVLPHLFDVQLQRQERSSIVIYVSPLIGFMTNQKRRYYDMEGSVQSLLVRHTMISMQFSK